jgi:hypothetical protein
MVYEITIDMKSKYIGRGHLLTNNLIIYWQYNMDNKDLIRQYAILGFDYQSIN